MALTDANGMHDVIDDVFPGFPGVGQRNCPRSWS